MEYRASELGPLAALLNDPSVMEILVDAPDRICVERHGKLVDVAEQFADNEALLRAIKALITPLGRVIDESHPLVDVRLPDRSLMTAVIPPISPLNPVLVIRKFRTTTLSVDDLLRYEAFSPAIVTFLRACVSGRINLLVSGGTGSGKTTLMNCLCDMIPVDERVIAVERVGELALSARRLVRLEARPADNEGRGGISVRDLIIQAMKMRPDRLVVSELAGAEVLPLLQAINTGHDGSMASIHATSPQDALARMEAMASMGEVSLPLLTIRQQLAAALGVIVQINRLADGQRRVTQVSEVLGLEHEMVAVRDIFRFVEESRDEQGRFSGQFSATGHVPAFVADLRRRGIDLPAAIFSPAP